MDNNIIVTNKGYPEGIEIGFTCDICGGLQPLPYTENIPAPVYFPVCNQCKADLKEIILEKRNSNKS